MKKILFPYHGQNQIAIQVLPVAPMQISLVNTSYSLQLLEGPYLLYKMELDSFTFSVFKATSSKSQKLPETYIFHMFPATVVCALSFKLDIICVSFRENNTLKKLCMFVSDHLTALALFSNLVQSSSVELFSFLWFYSIFCIIGVSIIHKNPPIKLTRNKEYQIFLYLLQPEILLLSKAYLLFSKDYMLIFLTKWWKRSTPLRLKLPLWFLREVFYLLPK